MADQKSEPKQAEQPKPQPKKEPPPVLGSAAASTDPVVQNLLAHREIAVSNGDGDAVDAVDAQLAELGVE
jgi:hypothetical protein